MRFGVIALLVMLLSGCLEGKGVPLVREQIIAEPTTETGVPLPEIETPEFPTETAEDPTENTAENTAEETGVEPTETASPVKPRRGLAALFGRRKSRVEEVVLATPEKTDETEGSPLAPVKAVDEPEMPTASPEAIAEANEAALVASVEQDPAPRRPRKGLFGPRRAKSDQAPTVDPNIMLPFGQVSAACGIRGKALGKEVDRFPARGKGYKLFDTKPTATGPRTHFITGFKDGCPRKFTASLALLSSPVLHEQLLAAEGDKGQHSTSADVAFQKARAQVCRTGRGKACPEKHVAKMEKSMVFVTTYERFGGAARWTEILLHNGVVKANSLQD